MTDNKPDLTHEHLADVFDRVMNSYDLEQRMRILIDDFLGNIDLKNGLILDAGCGTGHASARLASRSERVISIDLGEQLARLTHQRAGTPTAQASILDLPFKEGAFDVVFSTEVIEHTPDPLQAVHELWRVIKEDGWLVLSTPNRLWQLPVRVASSLGIRPYDGYENFLSPRTLKRYILSLGGHIEEHRGIHLFPFQISFLHRINRRLDDLGRILLPIMINQAILVRKLSDRNN